MAQLVVRNLDESIKAALKERASLRGTSMESEARDILRRALQRSGPRRSRLGSVIRARFAKAKADGDTAFEPATLPSAALQAPELPD